MHRLLLAVLLGLSIATSVLAGCSGGTVQNAPAAPTPTGIPLTSGYILYGGGTVSSTAQFTQYPLGGGCSGIGPGSWNAVTFQIFSPSTPAPSPTPNPAGTFLQYFGTYTLSNGDAGQIGVQTQRVIATPAPVLIVGASNSYALNTTTLGTFTASGCATYSWNVRTATGTIALDNGVTGTFSFSSVLPYAHQRIER